VARLSLRCDALTPLWHSLNLASDPPTAAAAAAASSSPPLTHVFWLDGLEFEMVDASRLFLPHLKIRRVVAPYFEHMDAVFFVVDLSHHNDEMLEDRTTNNKLARTIDMIPFVSCAWRRLL